MTENLNKWRVIITSTQVEDYVWRSDSQGAPTVASGGEAIDTEKSRIIDFVEPGEITIKEETVKTGGHFKFESIKMTCPGGTTSKFTFSWPFDINVISTSSFIETEMEGDFVSWYVADNTSIGTLTSDATAGDLTLNVAQTVVDNLYTGFNVRLASSTDPTGTYEDVGHATGVDSDNLQISVEASLSSNWSSTTPPTLVQMKVHFVENSEVGPGPYKIKMGADKIGSSYLPANSNLYCEYNNMTSTGTKTYYVTLEYLY